MANFFTKLFGGTKQEKDIKRLRSILDSVKNEYSWAESLKNEDFPVLTNKWKEEVKNGTSLDSLLPKAFALAREASFRTIGEKHYDEQVMGGIVLHSGSILEMKTGEGKTLTSVLPAYLNALDGNGVQIVTVNDYLARRDSEWMGKIYRFLGLSVAVVLPEQNIETKKAAYEADITYGTNNELGFDYLRDNMVFDMKQKVQRNHHYCIIDEIDSILIDEARTPLIISGKAEDDTPRVMAAKAVVPFLKECEKDPETGDYYELSDLDKFNKEIASSFDERGDYKLDEKNKRVTLTKQGMTKVEEALVKLGALEAGIGENGEKVYSLYDGSNFVLVHYVTQALRARYLFQRDVDYIIKDGEVQIVDNFTGRVLPGRRYSDGLHQAIEAKEGVKIKGENKTVATITLQNFFRMYDKICGMTGTADTEAMEFKEIYNLDVVVIPTHLPVKRIDKNDLAFYNEEYKFNAIVECIKKVHATGQPILVGTASIEKSELLSALLRKNGIKHEVLNAKHHDREAYIIAEAGRKGAVTIATNMAGRGTDIKLGGSPEHLALKKCGTDATEEEIKKAVEEVQDEYRKAYEEVKALGGLYVIGSERHESRRIDNQLRGRSGRQGDPGVSQFYVSFDDTIMRLFGQGNIKGVLDKLITDKTVPIEHKMFNTAVENAQKRVEEINFSRRKNVLEYDNVLNEQRTFIYKERDEILLDDNLLGRIEENISDRIDDIYEENKGNDGEISKGLQNLFNTQFTQDEIKDKEKLKTSINSKIEEKMSSFPTELSNLILKTLYLGSIEKRWTDHLDQLDELRDASSLMSYAQKNPIVEYKNNASDAFVTMLNSITEDVLKTAYLKNFSIGTAERNGQRRAYIAVHENSQMKNSNNTSRPGQENMTVRRTTPKVGRNDPCPCGSGKKYKNCCGRGF